MKVYVAMIEDRHSGTDCEVFDTAEAAIDWAKKSAQEWAYLSEDYEEREVKGQLFHVRYSVESDRIWVEERELR